MPIIPLQYIFIVLKSKGKRFHDDDKILICVVTYFDCFSHLNFYSFSLHIYYNNLFTCHFLQHSEELIDENVTNKRLGCLKGLNYSTLPSFQFFRIH